jgi:hypothetical protein
MFKTPPTTSEHVVFTNKDVDDFRTPKGCVAITFDFHNSDPHTFWMRHDELMPLLAQIPKVSKADYYGLARHVISQVAKEGADRTLHQTATGFIGMWCAFHHPMSGKKMHTAVAKMMRDKGFAHITFCATEGMAIGFTLSEKYTSISGMLEASQSLKIAQMVVGPYGDLLAMSAR